MVRQLYIILLALHPARFRYRFALEMLAIFDEASAQGSRLPLLADAAWSLIRQWLRPYRPVAAPVVAAGAGLPSFCSLDESLPKRRHLATGVALSVVLFGALATSIGRDWGRNPGALIGSFLFRPGVFEVARQSIQAAAGPTDVNVRPTRTHRPRATGIYPPFSFGVLDRDGDQVLSAAEMAAAPAMLQTLDRDGDGSLGPAETYLVLAVLDLDRDRTISKREISRSTDVLRGLDADRDGTLRPEETILAILDAAREYRRLPNRNSTTPATTIRLSMRDSHRI